MVVPDQTQKVVYEAAVRDNLKDGDMLMFAHGFNIHYSQIVPPANVDVTMVAPKGPGHLGPPRVHRGWGSAVTLRRVPGRHRSGPGARARLC